MLWFNELVGLEISFFPHELGDEKLSRGELLGLRRKYTDNLNVMKVCMIPLKKSVILPRLATHFRLKIVKYLIFIPKIGLVY